MKNKLRFALIVAIPIIICIIAISIRVTVPKADTISIEGSVEVDLRPYYTQATGEVTSLPVGVGQTVAKGDVLAVLDDSQARFELEQLEYTLMKAQAALRDLNQTDNEQLRKAQVRIAENNIDIAGRIWIPPNPPFQGFRKNIPRCRPCTMRGSLPSPSSTRRRTHSTPRKTPWPSPRRSLTTPGSSWSSLAPTPAWT
jgi:multidrug resistance efflux pump